MNPILSALGVINETSQSTRIITPYADGTKAFVSFLASASISGAKLRTMIYGCTLSSFFDGVLSAKKSGCDVKIIFDHTQSTGHAEAPMIAELIKEGFVDGSDFLIGTSPKHEIVHLKQTTIWLPDGSVTTLEGSWNYSKSASLEMNMLSFNDSQDLAKYTSDTFDKLWEWISTHEEKYQIK